MGQLPNFDQKRVVIKSWSEIKMASDMIEEASPGMFRVWHPLGKYIGIEQDVIELYFGRQKIGRAQIRAHYEYGYEKGDSKVLYDVNMGIDVICCYDYWLEFPYKKLLEDDLFEI